MTIFLTFKFTMAELWLAGISDDDWKSCVGTIYVEPSDQTSVGHWDYLYSEEMNGNLLLFGR